MPAKTTNNRVFQIIEEQLNVDAKEVTRSANLVDDLGADSLDVVELIMALEDEFAIAISDEAAEKVKTVADVLALVTSLKAPPAQ
jgi:acyl carrier protein